jgi:hypothetical protein
MGSQSFEEVKFFSFSSFHARSNTDISSNNSTGRDLWYDSKRKKIKRRLQFREDDPEFYSNIWCEDQLNQEQSRCQMIDISQVAHMMTSVVDFRLEYDDEIDPKYRNIWQCEFSGGANQFRESLLLTELEANEIKSKEEPMGESQFSNKVKSMKNIVESLVNVCENKKVKKKNENAQHPFLQKAIIPVSSPSKAGCHIVFSTVFLKEKETWNAKFLLGIHEPIRHALFVIDKFLDRSACTLDQDCNGMMEWNASEFFVWFRSYLMAFLKCQHEIKNRILHPFLRLQRHLKRQIFEAYEEIFFIVDSIIFQEANLLLSAATSKLSWLERVRSLQHDVRKLNQKLSTVLTVEEKTLSSAIAVAFTEKSFEKYMIPRMFKAIKPKRVIIPWIIERSKIWGGQMEAEKYIEQLPFSARFLYQKVWHAYFINHVASAMKNLDDPTSNQFSSVSMGNEWFRCSIQ